jgi:hypothetical protein
MAFQASCAKLVPAAAGEPPTAKCGPLAVGTLDAINKTDFGWPFSLPFLPIHGEPRQQGLCWLAVWQ